MPSLKHLRQIAMRFKIDTRDTVGDAARLPTLITVLQKINKSYQNFLQIELAKDAELRVLFAGNKNAVAAMLESLELLVVNLEFSSAAVSVAPNIADEMGGIFASKVREWEETTYRRYRDVILQGNYEAEDYLGEIGERYTDEERAAIFKPLFEATAGPKSDYVLEVTTEARPEPQVLEKPDPGVIEAFYWAEHGKKKGAEDALSTVQAFVRVKKGRDGSIDLNKRTIKRIIFVEEMEHDTYPYKTDVIRFDGIIYSLTERIECEVRWEEDMYVMQYEPLKMLVWGGTREELEEAFAFHFHGLYVNYALAPDSELTEGAVALKNQLLHLVKSTFAE